MTIRDELAKMIASPLHNLDNKYGDHLSLARARALADAILDRYDLHPKGSVVVPAEWLALRVACAREEIEAWRTWLKEYASPAIISLTAARPGASHD